MTAAKLPSTVTRVTLTRPEAAAALGVSLTTFDEAIRPELKSIRLGRVLLFRVAELEEWAALKEEPPVFNQLRAA